MLSKNYLNTKIRMIKSFLNYLLYEKKYSPKTITAYEHDLQQLEDFVKEEYELSSALDITYPILRAWLVRLTEQGFQARSINRKMATTKSFFKYLLREKLITHNPSEALKSLKISQKPPVFVEEDKILRLLDENPFQDTFVDLRSQLILEILYGTGIRLSELIGMTWESVDFSQKQVKVLGKGKKERIIPINDALLHLIKKYELKKQSHFEGKIPHSLLIVGDRGGPAYPMLIYKTVKSYLETITTKNRKSPHVLRHSFATHLLNKGADLNAIKDLLGHSSLGATQIYTHNSLDRIKSVFKQAHPKA